MLHLSAFADEISPDIDEQIRVCRANGVTHIELRSVNKLNVLDFDKPLRATIRRKLADGGLGVVSIASPVGKSPIDEPWERAFERFQAAVEMALYFRAPLIRIFSYYPAIDGTDAAGYREEAIRRMRAKVEYLAASPDITLVHENEKGIFGAGGAACHDLLSSVNSPRLRAAFDFANFVQVGERPADNWPLLKEFTTHIHIKDARLADGGVVPAGQGDGDIAPILKDAYAGGYRGFLSLEPHLKVAGHSHGETGPELFRVAAQALRNLCGEQDIPLATGK